MQFAVKYQSGEVKIPPEFDDFAWVDREEVKKYQCIEGIPEEITKAIKLYSS